MPLPTDIRVLEAQLFLLPVQLRVPLKFGAQVVTQVICARARVTVADQNGRTALGWGETPLSVAWVWPSTLSWLERESRLIDFCRAIAERLPLGAHYGHPMELADHFQRYEMKNLLNEIEPHVSEPMPHLAALVCHSLFDIATHDAFGHLLNRSVFDLLGPDVLSTDLAGFLDNDVAFAGRFPSEYLRPAQTRLPVWHLVGGLDPISAHDLTGEEPADGYPVLLRDWIRADGLRCLKIKLRGNDAAWDYSRLVQIADLALEEGCDWLSADFNCTVTDPEYVCEILDRLLVDHPAAYAHLLYIEQPFPYDLHAHPIDVRSVAARKPLFLDESAHDWRHIRTGRDLGWTSVALKTCKSLTGALLSLCWARAHGMTLMVQDLTNPMLAQLSHVALAAHAGTIWGVESNGMQFCPAASIPEKSIHPGIFQRRHGVLDLSTLYGSGFGYRITEIPRTLPTLHG